MDMGQSARPSLIRTSHQILTFNQYVLRCSSANYALQGYYLSRAIITISDWMLFLNELSEDIYHTNINHQEQYKHQQNNNRILNIKFNS